MVRAAFGRLVVTCVAVWGCAAGTADLSKVDRGIGKEPAYRGKNPEYMLLVFGAEARTRVWVVRDGDTLYVDVNGNGDLTEPGEAVAAVGGKFEPVAITANADVAPGTRVELQFGGGLTYVYCHTKGKPWQRAVVDCTGKLQLATTRAAAPVVHFNGPLTLAPRFEQTLERGTTPTDLEVMVGTPGSGAGTFARLCNDDIDKSRHPVAEMTFPTNGKPQVVRVVLEQRC